MTVRHIIHVHLEEPYEGRQDWYFGSLKAIYQKLPPEVLGLRLYRLWQAKAGKGEEIRNEKCRIQRAELYLQERKPKQQEP